MKKLFSGYLLLSILMGVFFHVSFAWGNTTLDIGADPNYPTIYSDTLLVYDFIVSDTISITLGSVVSRLNVAVLDQNEWRAISSDHWLWNPNSGAWRIRNEYHNEYEDSIDVRFIYVQGVFEPSFNDSVITKGISISEPEFELNQSGRITRGIISGTNQEASLESGLDIRLQGNISEYTTLSAVLTDRNIPFQPDGSTQTIREFDQVLIQVQNPKYTLEMGDVDVLFENHQFHRLDRRIRGGYFERQMNDSDKVKGTLKGMLSTTRGEYANEQLVALEGVQGPYRLGGESRSMYSVILAGTEKVYLNGQLLKRGADFDYVIDYSLGEITFTKQQLIRQETRLFVEYEFIEQAYNRSLVASEGGIVSKDKKFSFHTMYSREADNDGLVAQQLLSDEAIQLLQNTNNPTDLYFDSGRLWEDISDVALAYTKKDTLVAGIEFTIYEHSSNSNIPDGQLYRVNFNYLGPKLGDYELVEGSLNQPIYRWVGPNNGAYTSKEPLKAPIQHQILSARGSYHWSPDLKIMTDWSVSDYQYNRFSKANNGSKIGMAYEAAIQWDNALGNADQSTMRASIRTIDESYEPSERIQEVEYVRDYDLDLISNEQRLLNGGWRWKKSDHFFELGVSTLEAGNEGRLRQFFAYQSKESTPLEFRYNQDFVRRTTSLTTQGYWLRQQANLKLGLRETSVASTFKNYSFGLYFEQEEKLRKPTGTDSLDQTSLRFWSLGPGLNADYDHWSWGMTLMLRQEEQAFEGSWAPSYSILEQRYQLSWMTDNGFTGNQLLHIRNRKINEISGQETGTLEEQSLLLDSRISWGAVDRLGRVNWDYEAFSKQRSSFREVFVYVGPELGQFVWIDDNEDRIQQVIEFYPELSPNEGSYIRRLLPGNNYEPMVQLRTSFDYEWEPFERIKKMRPLLGALKVQLNVLLRDENKSNSLKNILALDKSTLFEQGLSVNGGKDVRYHLRFMPNLTGFEGGVEWIKMQTNHERNIEYLIHAQQSLQSSMSYRWNSQLKSQMVMINTHSLEYSDKLVDKNYAWSMRQFQPSLDYRYSRSWNIEISGFIKTLDSDSDYASEYLGPDKTSEGFSDFSLDQWQLSMNHKLFIPNGIQANLQVAIQEVISNDLLSPYTEYRLTDGMGFGRTAKWQINSTYRWNDWLELQFDYYGRTSHIGSGIHTLQLKVSALF